MAGVSDKARFYLEQYVPELQEYEQKGIFSRPEITAIASKRSDFEHTLNARGSKPSDYARYATYEINLDNLRKKRSKRLGVKTTAFNGQRTVFFILDRATRKFPGDMGLWMQYVHYCQRETANKKLAKVFTSLLRLKPREWGLWVLAAKHYAEQQGDMSMARSYMQRGLRFCKDIKSLWMEYLRLEVVYVAKLAARREILGLDQEYKDPRSDQPEEDEDMLMLPTITAEDINPDATRGLENVDASALQKLASAPVFTGAIPIAIFDAAMKQFDNNLGIAREMFDVIALFGQVPSAKSILQHILSHLQATAVDHQETVICEAKIILFGIDADSAEFPSALGTSLAMIKQGIGRVPAESQANFADNAVLTLLPYARNMATLDEDLAQVLRVSIRRYLRLASRARPRKAGSDMVGGIPLLERLKKDDRQSDVDILQQIAEDLPSG